MFRQNQDMIRSNYICKSYDKSDKCEFEKQEINKEAKTDFSSESQIIKTEKSRIIVEKESKVNSETDKISQETIKENFPFPTFLKDQLEILTEIVDAIEDGYKYIILESGVGKSAIAATLANIYESSFILSDNKKLQEKYHEEYDLINNDKFHVSNHSDAFNEFEKLDKRKLLIVDDAHKFDENIADFFSYKIRLSAFDDELIDSFYCDVRNKEKKEIDVGLDFINHLSLDDEMVNLIKYNIEENPDDWIWFYDKYYGGMIIFKPLNLENILKKYLLNKAEICIFMSSTVLNKEIFADELGLDISEVKFIHKDFPFSSDANQIYLRNCAAMNDSQNVKLVSPFIEYILEKHKNEKGIIHTDKPEYTSCIENQINNPRLMIHIDDDDLKEFKNSSNSVLVSEDRVEGMDFPKDSCRFQIILRQHLIPYDEIAKYKDNESNWYSYKKAIYLVQLLQRAARSEDDGCITYILDERILTTIRKDIMDYHFIPDYILDSIEDMDVGGCELISDNVKKQLGVYYLFDYYNEALELFNEILDSDYNRNVLDLKVDCLFFLGKFEAVVKTADEYLEVFGNNLDVLTNKKAALKKLNRKNEAEEVNNIISNLNAVNKFAVYMPKDQTDEVIPDEIYERELELCFNDLKYNPDDSTVLIAIATFLYNLDRRDESIEYLDKISDDADSVTINAKACMFMKLEKFPKALETLNKSLKKDKTNIITLISKSECLMELKKYEEVLVCADEGLEIDKTNMPLWKNKFCALIELDRLIEAKEVQDLIFDLEIANDKAEGSLKKAINRFYSMEYRECLNLCYDVLDADKDNEEAAILMMNAVYLLGDLTEAPKALYRALNCNNGEILTRN